MTEDVVILLATCAGLWLASWVGVGMDIGFPVQFALSR